KIGVGHVGDAVDEKLGVAVGVERGGVGLPVEVLRREREVGVAVGVRDEDDELPVVADDGPEVDDLHVYVWRVDGRERRVLERVLGVRDLEDASLRVVEEENLGVAVGVVARRGALGRDVALRLDDDEAPVAAYVRREGVAGQRGGRRRRGRRRAWRGRRGRRGRGRDGCVRY